MDRKDSKNYWIPSPRLRKIDKIFCNNATNNYYCIKRLDLTEMRAGLNLSTCPESPEQTNKYQHLKTDTIMKKTNDNTGCAYVAPEAKEFVIDSLHDIMMSNETPTDEDE